MGVLVGTFNQEKALVGALPVIVKSSRTLVCSSSGQVAVLVSPGSPYSLQLRMRPGALPGQQLRADTLVLEHAPLLDTRGDTMARSDTEHSMLLLL